jgi:cyclic pyranopterin phosphate synthase
VPRAGFTGTKLDTVVIRGVNDDELAELIEFGKRVPAEVRFIEYMDVGGATAWTPAQVVPREELLATVAARHGALEELPRGSAPADRYRAADGTVFGVIASTTRPFCAACDRSRLTADGTWYLCLYAAGGLDLCAPLRAGASDDELRALLTRGWVARDDRGAEVRLAQRDRGPSVERTELLTDPRREMHTRGG